MHENARLGFVVNDLHRHWLAYHSISILTRFFSRSHLVRHDARLSVAKGFSKQELQSIFRIPDGKKVTIDWRWAFRWQMIGL